MVLKNFVVFEGIDGAGTSTQIRKIVESDPQKYTATAEPTSLPTGKFLRRMLSGEFHVDEKTNAYLFAADRCEHIFGKGGHDLSVRTHIAAADHAGQAVLRIQSAANCR